MANKITNLFKKNNNFPIQDTTTNGEIKDLIQEIDNRLTKVEDILKELVARK